MTDRPLHLDAWRRLRATPSSSAAAPPGLSAALVLGRANKRVLVLDDGPAGERRVPGRRRTARPGSGDAGRPAPQRAAAARGARRTSTVRHGAVAGRRADGGRVRGDADGRGAASAPMRSCSRTGCATTRRRCPGSRRSGDGRCSTARSATAGRCATGPWRCTAAAPAPSSSALVLAGWSNDVVLCTDGAPDPGGALLAAAGVRVRTEPIARLAGNDGRLDADRVLARPGRARARRCS